MYSCEYCETFKNTYFEAHLLTTTFEQPLGLFITIRSIEVGLLGFLKHVLSLIKCLDDRFHKNSKR